MKQTIAIVSICFAAALSTTPTFAGRDGGQLLYQSQVLQRIKHAAGPDRTETRRPQLAYWDSRRSPTQTW